MPSPPHSKDPSPDDNWIILALSVKSVLRAWTRIAGPTTFVSKVSANRLRVQFPKTSFSRTPALDIRISMYSPFPSKFETSWKMLSSEARSKKWIDILGNWFARLLSVSAFDGFRQVANTLDPVSAYALAKPSPIPRLAPVMSTGIYQVWTVSPDFFCQAAYPPLRFQTFSNPAFIRCLQAIRLETPR